MSDHPFALYNPALLPANVLLGEYTARRPLLETLLGIVKSNHPGHPPQHCLLIGARGMGKTTTLWAVAHRIQRDPDLSRLWQPVVFDEESRRIGDLADFWLEAVRQWEFVTKDHGDRAGRLLIENPPDIEDRARQAFLDLVTRSGKRVVLLIDNLNDLLASIRDPEPLHRLRAFLMQDSGVMIIGGATSYFEQITSVDQPFYDFFRSFELKALTLEEMRDCLQTLARKRKDHEVETALEERSGSIQALHLLTGGNPRLIKTLYRLLRDGLQGDIRSDLENLLDEFTPYFKAIVDALPGQQQRILDAVALAWDPVEVAALATVTRLPSNQVSAQLRSLLKTGLVREAAGRPKRKTYLLTDRFSNIHYLMRHGRAARNRLDWFVATIRLLFPDRQAAELLARLVHDSAECGTMGHLDARDMLRSGLSRSESAESRLHLLNRTLHETWSAPAMEKLAEWFDLERVRQDMPEIDIIAFCQHMPVELRKDLGFKPEAAWWWGELAKFLEGTGEWDLAEAAHRKAIELDRKKPDWWNGIANLYAHRSRFSDAETAYRCALQYAPEGATIWYNLGNLLKVHLNRLEEAEEAYRKAIEFDHDFAYAWNNLGRLFQDSGKDPREAEKAFKKAIESDASGHELSIPWHNLGNLYQYSLGRFDESEMAYRKSIELDKTYAYPWNGLANLLSTSASRAGEARACALRALTLSPNHVPSRDTFLGLCAENAGDWLVVLPALADWCTKHPKNAAVFDFTVDAFIRYARLTSPKQALELIESLANTAPFETMRDVMIACDERDHLHRLAPERQIVVMELVKRVQSSSVRSE